MAGMLLSEIAARNKQHTLETAGIEKAEARLKLTHPAPAAVQYCGVQLSRLPSHHQTQEILEWWVPGLTLAGWCLGRTLVGFTKDAGVDVMLLVRTLTIYSIIGRGKLKLTVATTTTCNNSFGLAGVHALW
jgi:hypothetical protein